MKFIYRVLFYVFIFIATVYLTQKGYIGYILPYFPLLILIVIAASLAYGIYNSTKYYRLFLAGKVDDAFRYLDKKERSSSKNPSTLARLRYARASLLTYMGDYQASNDMLALSLPLKKKDVNLEAVYASTQAFNLYLMDPKDERVAPLVRDSLAKVDFAGNHLLLAASERELGRVESARSAMETFLLMRAKNTSFKFGKTLLFQLKKATGLRIEYEEYLLGRYYLADWEHDLAKKHLSLSAASTTQGHHSRLSRQILNEID